MSQLLTRLVCLLLLMTGCQWDLEEEQFPTFNRTQTGLVGSAGKLKRGILGRPDGRFLTGGTADDGRMLLTAWQADGTHEPVAVNFPPGTIHAIQHLGENDSTFLILATDAMASYLYRVLLTDAPAISRLDRLNRDVDEQIGLLQALQLYDIVASPRGTWLATGTLKQSIGAARLVLVELDEAFNVLKLFTFENGVMGLRILPYGEDGAVIGSLTNDNRCNVRYVKLTTGQVWQRNVAGERYARIPDLVVDSEREVVLVAVTRQERNEKDPYLVVLSLTEDGKEVAAHNIDLRGGQESAYTLAPLRNGDLLIGGIEQPGSPLTDDRYYFFINVDTAGSLQWYRSLETRPGELPGFPVAGGQSPDLGTYLFATERQSPSDTIEVQRIFKLDEVGRIEDNF